MLMEPPISVIFLMPFALPLAFAPQPLPVAVGPTSASAARIGPASASACAQAFSPANEPTITEVAAPATPVAGRSKPMPLGARFANVTVLGFRLAPDADHLIAALNGVVPGVSRPEQVPGVVPVLVTTPLALVIGLAPMVPPLEVQVPLLVLAVVVDGCVLMSLSAGLIFTLPVVVQLTEPVALPSATLPADAGPAITASPPSASAAAEAVSTTFRSMPSPLGCFRVSPLILEA